jgi:proteasome lid subunit RPN8/RPN11
MQTHLAGCLPEEACGMVGGRATSPFYQAVEVIPISNELHSSQRFRMDPHEQLHAFMTFEENGLELVAIYHSHPSGPEGPSSTDIAEAYYPDTIQLIWRPVGDQWRCRGFLIQNEIVHEALVMPVE